MCVYTSASGNGTFKEFVQKVEWLAAHTLSMRKTYVCIRRHTICTRSDTVQIKVHSMAARATLHVHEPMGGIS